MATTASKLMDAFSRATNALQRLQTGSSQVVTVQHVQINRRGTGARTVLSPEPLTLEDHSDYRRCGLQN
jgi:hypothetical protein